MAKAIISSTYDNRYLYFIPLVTFCWNKLGVDVICFMPYLKDGIDGYNPDKEKRDKYALIIDTLDGLGIDLIAAPFVAPEHKEATYAQCLRNYAACLDLSGDELLITSDVDMAVFKIPERIDNGNWFSVFGSDLVPDGQYPQCYISAPAKAWRDAFNLYDKTYQQAIDELLGDDECQDYRGCRWSVDQEQSYLKISNRPVNLIPRAKEGTQFSTLRYDRDDSYILDRLSPDTIDYHMNRPGFQENNFNIILTILKYHFPQEDFTWLVNYNSAYKKLL